MRLVLLLCLAASTLAAMQPIAGRSTAAPSHPSEVAKFLPIEARYVAELDLNP